MKKTVMLSVLGLASICATDAEAGDSTASWAQFRGPFGAGSSRDDTAAPTEFGPDSNLRWKIDLPHGLSSPCVWNDRIFVTSFDSDRKTLETICIDRDSGAERWRKSVSPENLEEVHKTSSPATATPATDGERVYVYFGSYGLIAYEMDGEKAWELRLPVARVMFGSGTSPIVIGDVVVLNRQQGSGRRRGRSSGGQSPTSEILGVNAKTGAVQWRAEWPPSFAGVGYSTPVHRRLQESDEVLLVGGGRLIAYEVKTGEKQWEMVSLPMVAAATPTLDENHLYVNCVGLPGDVDVVKPPAFEEVVAGNDQNGDGKLQRDEIPGSLAVLTRHRADGEGDFGLKQWFFRQGDSNRDGVLSKDEWTRIYEEIAVGWTNRGPMQPKLMKVRLPSENQEAEVVWEVKKGVPEVPSLLAHDGRVYALRNGGVIGCYDAEDGALTYRSRIGSGGAYYASPVTDGTYVFIGSLSGKVIVLRPGDSFHRVALNDLQEPIMATPAVVNGQLIIRTDSHLYAFGGQ